MKVVIYRQNVPIAFEDKNVVVFASENVEKETFDRMYTSSQACLIISTLGIIAGAIIPAREFSPKAYDLAFDSETFKRLPYGTDVRPKEDVVIVYFSMDIRESYDFTDPDLDCRLLLFTDTKIVVELGSPSKRAKTK